MKIIFLDIDGVLISQRTYRWWREAHITPEETLNTVDPYHVKFLNKIVEKSGAKVVITSTWRTSRTFTEIQKIFEKSGFTGEVVGCTPRDWHRWREREIFAWMEEHGMPDEYVVIDDDVHDLHQFIDLERFVWIGRTENGRMLGLQEEHVDPALRILKVLGPVVTELSS